MMSDDLGFSIEAIRQGFPDALVVDYRANPNRGVKKSIEFEFASSHFARKKHPVKGAQIIVCWEHDWKNCPKEIEVLELKGLIRKLKREEAEQEIIEEAFTPHVSSKTKKMEKLNYATSWNARLEWVDPSTRKLTERLIQRISHDLPNLVHQPRYRWYSFYNGQPLTERNQVAVILMGKKRIRLAIRTDPNKFSDSFRISNPVGKWFFPKRSAERRMPVTSENIEAIVTL